MQQQDHKSDNDIVYVESDSRDTSDEDSDVSGVSVHVTLHWYIVRQTNNFGSFCKDI